MYPFYSCFKFGGDGEGAIESDNGDVDEDDEDEHLIVVRVLLYHLISQLLTTETVWKDCREFPSLWVSTLMRLEAARISI